MSKKIAPRVAAIAASLLALGVFSVAMSSNSVAAEDKGHHHGHNHSDVVDPAAVAALEILGNDCSGSELEAHDGFQNAPRCVSTAFGEVAAQDKNPSLLIVDAPKTVKVGQPLELKISTRNLVRDRFLAAGQGGYYKESAFLNGDGITRGHVHTACRLVDDASVALSPDRQAIFKATEDNGGGVGADVFTVRFDNGLPKPGKFQCASWAGDGSHRIPMMQFANQIPAFDTVDIKVENRNK